MAYTWQSYQPEWLEYRESINLNATLTKMQHINNYEICLPLSEFCIIGAFKFLDTNENK